MKKNILKPISYAALLLIAPEAFAQTGMAKLVADLEPQFQAAANLLTTFSYLAGAGFAVQSALKFKEHNDNPSQTKLSKPITYALVAGMLLGLPSWMNVIDGTFNGENAEQSYSADKIIFK